MLITNSLFIKMKGLLPLAMALLYFIPSVGCTPPPPPPIQQQRPVAKATPKPPIAVLHPVDHLENKTLYSKRISVSNIKSLVILPPSGTAEKGFDEGLTMIESAFMSRGIELISPAIGARALEDKPNNLTDLERALVLAQKNSADAVLHIGQYSMGIQSASINNAPSSELGARYIVYDDIRNSTSEVIAEAYDRASPTFRFKFLAPIIRFKAKLISVTDGAILANYDFSCEITKALPKPYTAQLTSLTTPSLRSTSFEWIESDWSSEASARVISEILNEIAHSINPR